MIKIEVLCNLYSERISPPFAQMPPKCIHGFKYELKIFVFGFVLFFVLVICFFVQRSSVLSYTAFGTPHRSVPTTAR